MKYATTLTALAAVFAASAAQAADMPLKAPLRAPLVGYPYEGSGFYYGIGTFGEAQPVKVDTPAAVGTKTYAAGAGVSAVAGWQWTIGSAKWVALEGSLNYANTGADPSCGPSQGCPLNTRLSASQKVKFGGPIGSMLALLPDLSTSFPVLPPIPVGATNPTAHPYIMLVLHESRDELNTLTGQARKFKVRGGFGAGILTQVKDGMVLDTWAEYTLRNGALSTASATGDVGGQVRVGLSVLY